MLESLKAKLDTLKDLYNANKMDLYKRENGIDILTEEEAYQLYVSQDDLGVSKDVLFFLMSDENKRKYINDVEAMTVGFDGWHLMVKDKSLLCDVVERYTRNHKIKRFEIYTLYDAAGGNNELKYLLINRYVDRIGGYDQKLVLELPIEYQYKFYSDLIKKAKTESDLGVLIGEIDKIENQAVYNELIKQLIMTNSFKKIDDQHSRTLKLANTIPNKRGASLVKYLYDHCDEIQPFIHLEIMIARHSKPNEIIDYIENSLDLEYELVAPHLTYDNWQGIYDYVKNQNQWQQNTYLTPSFIAHSASIYPSEVYRKYFKEDLYNNPNFSALDKCEAIYSQFYNDKLQYLEEVDYMIEVMGEEMHPLFDALLQDLYEKYDISKYENIKKLTVQLKGITNIENFEKFIKRFGSLAISSLSNVNVVKFVNLDSESYDKIMNLIGDKNAALNMDVVNTVTNAFLHRQFKLDKADDYNIFSKFERLLQEKNGENVTKVASLLNKIFYEGINLSDFEKEDELRISDLFAHKKESINMLHEITDAYIAKKREMYIAERLGHAYNTDLGISKYYNKNYIKKKYFIYKDAGQIVNDLIGVIRKISLSEEEDDFYNSNRFLDVIEFKSNPTGRPTKEMINNLNILDGIMDKLYEQRLLTLYPEPNDVKYEYFLPEKDDSYLLSILDGIEAKHASEYMKNPELYQTLNSLFNKYKMPGWGYVFHTLGKKADLQVDNTTMYSLINYFDKIYARYQSLPEKSRTLTALLDIASAYSSVSNKYNILINKENLDYILTDPKPNASSSSKETRVSLVPSYVKKMYERNSVTIPSGEVTLEVGEEHKKIQVSMGDIYDPIALTYGERTGACLRIHGAFADLFDFCLENKNGFHIRFNDPQTGEFISRVSGIRNGNTVFLNELRYSVSDKYSSEDLVDTLKQIAKFLVESTKNDPHPIENVLVSNDYAMEAENSYDLKITNSFKAFHGLNFNINSTGNILYTAHPNHNQLMPYKFGDEHVSEYKPYNTKVTVVKGEMAQTQVMRIMMLNEVLKGKTMDEIELDEEIFVEKCIYGHGWVVYLDDKNKLHKMVIDKFKDDKRLQEMIENATRAYFGGVLNENIR